MQDSDTQVQDLEATCDLAKENAEDKQTIAILPAANASLVAELIQFRSKFSDFRKYSRTLFKHYC